MTAMSIQSQTLPTIFPRKKNIMLWPDACTIKLSDDAKAKFFNLEKILSSGTLLFDQTAESIDIVINRSLIKPLVIYHDSFQKYDIEKNSVKINLHIKSGVEAQVLHYFSDQNDVLAMSDNKILITTEDYSKLAYYKFSGKDLSGCHKFETIANINTNSQMNFFDLYLHDGQVDSTSDVHLNRNNAKCSFFALEKICANAVSNSKLNIKHSSPNTASSQIFRGLYAHKSQGSFLGKVTVDSGAYKSSARQHYKAIILDNDAQAHVMPQLEVNNSDISASHGASIGALDPQTIFYLRSRGLTESMAKSIMITSLSSVIIESIENCEIKNLVELQVNQAITKTLRDAS